MNMTLLISWWEPGRQGSLCIAVHRVPAPETRHSEAWGREGGREGGKLSHTSPPTTTYTRGKHVKSTSFHSGEEKLPPRGKEKSDPKDVLKCFPNSRGRQR